MAAPVVVTLPHNLGRTEARARLDKLMADMGNQLPGAGAVDQKWTGDRLDFNLQAMGQNIGGHADVADDQVRLEIRLPGFLGMMAGQIRDKIQRRGTAMLEGPKA